MNATTIRGVPILLPGKIVETLLELLGDMLGPDPSPLTNRSVAELSLRPWDLVVATIGFARMPECGLIPAPVDLARRHPDVKSDTEAAGVLHVYLVNLCTAVAVRRLTISLAMIFAIMGIAGALFHLHVFPAVGLAGCFFSCTISYLHIRFGKHRDT